MIVVFLPQHNTIILSSINVQCCESTMCALRFIDYIMHNRELKACRIQNKLWEKESPMKYFKDITRGREDVHEKMFLITRFMNFHLMWFH